ncbi:MAG: DctP family TRAP transporter solute-binding subunit [Desulfobacterales bacterium]|jgi:tripartite ATP-independent transporter DctP family solute receptor
MRLRYNTLLITVPVLFAFIIGLVVINPAQAAKYNWKFAHEELQGGFMDEVAREFADRLAAKSGGDIKIDIYPSGTLGTSEDLVELVQGGAIQFNWADAGHLGTQVVEVQALLLHYIFPKDIEIVEKVMKTGSFRDVLNPRFREKNLEPLAYFSEGWQIWTSNRALRSPEDFAGFKMRTMTSKLIVDNYKAYGANPTPTPFSEVYSALQLNMVDGQVNPAFVIYDMKFFEVQDYLNYAYSNPFILTLITNKEFYDSLPKNIQNMISTTAIELIPFGFKWQEEFNQKNLDLMLQKKPSLKIIKLSQREVDRFADLAKPVREVYYRMAPEYGRQLIEALEKDIKAAMGQ